MIRDTITYKNLRKTNLFTNTNLQTSPELDCWSGVKLQTIQFEDCLKPLFQQEPVFLVMDVLSLLLQMCYIQIAEVPMVKGIIDLIGCKRNLTVNRQLEIVVWV